MLENTSRGAPGARGCREFVKHAAAARLGADLAPAVAGHVLPGARLPPRPARCSAHTAARAGSGCGRRSRRADRAATAARRRARRRAARAGRPDPGIGIAASSSRVYGWRGPRVQRARVAPAPSCGPRYSTSTRSHRRRTTARLWLTNSRHRPDSRLRVASSSTICTWLGTSSELTGSSQTSSRGCEDHRARDADALALAAAELVRVALQQLRRRGPRAPASRRPLAARRAALERRLVHAQPLGDDLADRHARVEAAERVLEDDLQVAALRAQLARA